MINDGFESGWTRTTHTGQAYGEICVPEGWTAFWREGGTVPHDPDNTNGYGRPEMHVITREAPFLDPPRIRSGQRAVKLFTFYRIHDAGLYQRVTTVEVDGVARAIAAGMRLRFGAWAHAWTSTQDDPRVSEHDGDAAAQATFRVGIDPGGGTDPWAESVVWGPGASLYDVYGQIPAVEAVAEGGAVTVFVRSTMRYPFKHCDAYLDDAELVVIEDPEPAEPDPQEPEAGVDYVVTAHLLPQDTTHAELAHVLDVTYPDRRTLVYSAHDAARLVAPGLPGSAVHVWDKGRWTQGDIVAYLLERGVGIVREEQFPGTPGLPDVPPGGGEAQYPDPGPCLVGLHSQRPKSGWVDYYRQTRASVFKALELGMCVEAKAASPSTLVVYRHHVDNDGAWVHRPDLRAAAREFLDLYAADFALAAGKVGITVAKLLESVDVIESINEVIGTYDSETEPCVEFDCHFAEAIRVRYGHQLSAGLLTIAVGNPHESEVGKLLPAAKVAADGGHYLGYHPYWGSNRETGYLAGHWPHHAGRWAEWDTVFRAHNVYPLYYGGEAGACFAPDGWSLNPNLGWKGCGPFSRYIGELVTFQQLAREWNAAHGNRFRGAAIFCYGGYGWDGFDWEPGDLVELGKRMSE